MSSNFNVFDPSSLSGLRQSIIDKNEAEQLKLKSTQESELQSSMAEAEHNWKQANSFAESDPISAAQYRESFEFVARSALNPAGAAAGSSPSAVAPGGPPQHASRSLAEIVETIKQFAQGGACAGPIAVVQTLPLDVLWTLAPPNQPGGGLWAPQMGGALSGTLELCVYRLSVSKTHRGQAIIVLGHNSPSAPGSYTPDIGTWADAFPIALLQCIGTGLFKVVFFASDNHGLQVVTLSPSTSVLGLRPTALSLIETEKFDWPFGGRPLFLDRDWDDDPLTFGTHQVSRQSSGPNTVDRTALYDPAAGQSDSQFKSTTVSAKRAKELTDIKVFSSVIMKNSTVAGIFTGVSVPLFNADMLLRVRGALKRWWPALCRYKLVNSDTMLSALLSFSFSGNQTLTLHELASILDREMRTVIDLKHMLSLWLGLLDVIRVLSPDTSVMPTLDGYWASLGAFFFEAIQPLESMDQLSYEFAITLARDLLEAISMLVRNEYFLSLSGPERHSRLVDTFKLVQLSGGDLMARSIMFNSTNRGAPVDTVGTKRPSSGSASKDPSSAKKPSAGASKPRIAIGDQLCIAYLLNKRSIPGFSVCKSVAQGGSCARAHKLPWCFPKSFATAQCRIYFNKFPNEPVKQSMLTYIEEVFSTPVSGPNEALRLKNLPL